MDLGLLDHTKKYILNLIKEGKRIDGRAIMEYRKPITISFGVSKNAEGSAMVQWGKTVVVAGVKMEIGEPFPDTPDEGILVVSAELLPGAYPTYEPGPPGPEAVELARVVDRGLREGKTIDLKKLVIKEGEKVWVIFLDIYVMNDDGNVYDASALAAIAALLDTRFPKYDPEKDKIDYKEHTDQRLPIRNLPIAVTFAKVGEKIILDPKKEEEIASDAMITVTSTEDKMIRAIQKYGRGTFTLEELDYIFDVALERAEQIRKILRVEAKKAGINI